MGRKGRISQATPHSGRTRVTVLDSPAPADSTVQGDTGEEEKKKSSRGRFAEGTNARDAALVRHSSRAASENADDAIVKALEKKAKQGDVAAARELRAWRGEGAGEDTGSNLVTLTDDERDALISRYVAAVAGGGDEQPALELQPSTTDDVGDWHEAGDVGVGEETMNGVVNVGTQPTPPRGTPAERDSREPATETETSADITLTPPL